MITSETKYLHPRKWPALVPLAVGFGILIFSNNQENRNEYWIMASILIGFSILLFLAFRKARVVLDYDKLTYQTIFKKKEIRWQEVQKTFIKYHHHGKSGSRNLHFITKNGEEHNFSISLYSKNDLQQIGEAIIAKCEGADIQEKIRNMAVGIFPWYKL